MQWVCSDMYRPFEKSISDAMPNARWAIDHFHVDIQNTFH
ncbi:transposase [uncultured Clostridium sp.]